MDSRLGNVLEEFSDISGGIHRHKQQPPVSLQDRAKLRGGVSLRKRNRSLSTTPENGEEDVNCWDKKQLRLSPQIPKQDQRVLNQTLSKEKDVLLHKVKRLKRKIQDFDCDFESTCKPVSYTHLTLPTIYSV